MFEEQYDQTKDSKRPFAVKDSSARAGTLTVALADCEVVRRNSTMSNGRPHVDFTPASEGGEFGRTFVGGKSSS